MMTVERRVELDRIDDSEHERLWFTGRARKRLDFMAALRVSAAFSERESGVLEGVAESRVARDKPCRAAFCAGSPPERRHQ